MRDEDTGLRWFLRGVGGIVSVPAFILMASFVGFGVLCRESGITLGEAVFMTGFVWALPSQLVLVGAIAAGSPVIVAGVAVALSAIRLMPMTAAWVPLVRGPKTRKWQLILMSHCVAVTAWVWSVMRLRDTPPDKRAAYFAGFGATLITVNVCITAISYVSAASLPPLLAAGLFFLTPIYFLTALTASARQAAERLALVFGLVLGPLLRASGLGFDLLWAGVIGGTLAFAGHKLLLRSKKAGT
ncbi:putative branched-subunit amino acid permease [Rhodopseudomonas julia]|uniref:Branched-subunit amino acid permease n=1 Tax=Rhodopseudomonas julia TaxID=200617 RepID=A0ABU0C9R0_9BRAD|nr:AzlC family ABC transporter permease [Rhodopseudomonas julia]MDQ0327267.1 putative branched-subunit amino acid permease [Rhodopseudomonas julia]